MVATAYALIATFARRQDFWHLRVPFCILTGLGLSLLVAPLTAAVMANAPEADQGAACAINNATARAAGLVAVALMGRIAAQSYGPISPGMPGFALPYAYCPQSRHQFRLCHIAAACAVLALAAAIVSAIGLIKRLSARPDPNER